jgi:hypothetical protein
LGIREKRAFYKIGHKNDVSKVQLNRFSKEKELSIVAKRMNIMSEKNNIEERIKIIFDNERSKFSSDRFSYIQRIESPDSNNFYLEWETYTILKKLYNNIEKDTKSREIFIDVLKKELLNRSLASSLAFYFLLKIGKNLDIIITIDKRIDQIEQILYDSSINNLFKDIQNFMHYEPMYFDDGLLVFLKALNERLGSTSYSPQYEFDREISSIRYNRLKNELAGVNEEINIHKEQVIDMSSKFGFPPELGRFLLEIDNASELPDWESINSGMISNLRAFFEDLTKNIAATVKQITNKDYPKDPKKGKMGNLRDYIKNNLKLSDYDDKLVDAFIDILHNEGGHAFLSEKRYFLLTKNIGIEIAYFLLSKLEDLSEGKLRS